MHVQPGHFSRLLDYVKLLTVPTQTIVVRIESRTNYDFGNDPFGRHLILSDIRLEEPMLRRTPHREVDTARHGVAEMADQITALADMGPTQTQVSSSGTSSEPAPTS